MSLNRKVIIADDIHRLAEKGAQLVRETARKAVARQGRFSLALSGGSTPRAMHRLLTGGPYVKDIPWPATHIFWVDERVVPFDHQDSNFGAAERDLLRLVPIPEGNIHPMPVWLAPAEGADAYRAELGAHFGHWDNQAPRFDLIVLGIGTDGHTASLFPGQPFTTPAADWVLAVRGGNPDVERITLSGSVINAAKSVCIMAAGGPKAALVEALIEGSAPPPLPAAKVRPVDGRLTWLIDRQAAACCRPMRVEGEEVAMNKNEAHAWVLAGDIGGTKTNLGLFRTGGTRPRSSIVRAYPSRSVPDLESLIARFLNDAGVPVSAACFGIAGPVIEGRSKTTNLPWQVSAARIERRFGLRRVRLVNDLAATAHAVPLLRCSEYLSLNRARVIKKSPMALIAPGTGLGQAFLISDRGRTVSIASEGGHADFAPVSPQQAELWATLHRRFGHVSIERVLSGGGLVNIFEWVQQSRGLQPPPWLSRRMAAVDPARAISEAALAGKDPGCVAALQLFVSIFGSVAGNLALTAGTRGGVYLGGGIPPKILPALQDGRFMNAYGAKGRFDALLAKIPVRVILNDRAALLGAAQLALQL